MSHHLPSCSCGLSGSQITLGASPRTPGKQLSRSAWSLWCARAAPRPAGEGPGRLPSSSTAVVDRDKVEKASPRERLGRDGACPNHRAKCARGFRASKGRLRKALEVQGRGTHVWDGQPRGRRRGPKEGRMLPGCGGRKVSMATGGVEGLRRALGGSVAGRPGLSPGGAGPVRRGREGGCSGVQATTGRRR